MVTEQTITDQAKYEKEFAPAAIKTIKDASSVIVRGGDVTHSLGHEPETLTGWKSLDDVKKWQGGQYAKLIPIRDQSAKIRQFAVFTSKSAGCEARPDQVPN